MKNNSIIGKVVKNEDLYKVAEGITRKALKVMETKGNKFARDIIENGNYYKKDDFEDIMQNVVEQILIDNYIITKDCFKVVNKYINNLNKFPTIKTITENGKIKYIKMEKLEIDKEDEKDVELLNYISFLAYNDKKIMMENDKKEKSKDIIEMLDLTDRQKEILDIYSKIQNAQKTAELLGINCNTVKTTIKRIREKTSKLNIQIA